MRKILIVLCVCFIAASAWGQTAAQDELSWENVEKTMFQIAVRFDQLRVIYPNSLSVTNYNISDFNSGVPPSRDYYFAIRYDLDYECYYVSFNVYQDSARTFAEISDLLSGATRTFIRDYGQPADLSIFTAIWECRSWYTLAHIDYGSGSIRLTIFPRRLRDWPQ